MTIDDFANLFGSFHGSAFRLETLPVYTVEEERETYRRFLAGSPLPPEPRGEWFELVAAASAAGKTMQRVRVLSEPVGPYLRFEIEWCYPYNAEAGEQISIIDLERTPKPVVDAPFEDFWLFDDSIVVRMVYDDHGQFVGVAGVTDTAEISAYRRTRDLLLNSATPFAEYLAKTRAN